MNDQQVQMIGKSIDVFMSDTRRRFHQLVAAVQNIDEMLRVARENDVRRGAQRDSPDAEAIREKLKRIQDAGLGNRVQTLANDVEKLAREILNGDPVPGERRECVAIQLGGALFSCSGVMIDAKWVVTSAHCTNPTRIYVGDDIFDGVVGHSVFDVVDEGLCGPNDEVRLLRVIGKIPNPAIATVAYGAEFDVGTAATIVGFGATVPGGVKGRKRAGEVIINSQDPLTTSPGAGGADATFGDSGGPLIVEESSKHIIYGLIEGGLRAQDGQGTVYIKFTQALVDLIEKEIQVSLRKYPPLDGRVVHDAPADPPVNAREKSRKKSVAN